MNLLMSKEPLNAARAQLTLIANYLSCSKAMAPEKLSAPLDAQDLSREKISSSDSKKKKKSKWIFFARRKRDAMVSM